MVEANTQSIPFAHICMSTHFFGFVGGGGGGGGGSMS